MIAIALLALLSACETTNGAASKVVDSVNKGGGAACVILPVFGGGNGTILYANQDQEKGRRGGTLTAECGGAKLVLTTEGPAPEPPKPAAPAK